MKRLVSLLALLVSCGSPAPAPRFSPPAVINLAVLSPQPPPPTPPAIVSEHVVLKAAPRCVLIIGDSEACAVGLVADQVAQEWARKRGQPKDDVAVECKGGTTIPYWNNLHAYFALQAHPNADVVLVFLGTNHFWQKQLPSPQPILDLILKRGASCVWVGNVAVGGKAWPIINQALEAAVTPQCKYFNSEQEPIKLWDGYHPHADDAKRWLSDVWDVIPPKYEELHD